MRLFVAASSLLSCLMSIAQVSTVTPAIQTPLEHLPYAPVLDVSSLDRTMDPCTNFYQYVCGGWLKKNPIPADRAAWSVYSKLAYDNQQFLWGILRDAAAGKNRTAVQQKIGDYFAACMDEAAIERRGMDPVRPTLARIAGYPTREALLADLPSFAAEVDGDFFLSAGSEPDPSNAEIMIADQGPAALGLPDRDYYTKNDARSLAIRQRYVVYVAQLLTMSGEPAEQAQADATAVLRLETALANASLTRVERRDPYKSVHRMVLADLQTAVPALQWAEFYRHSGAPAFSTLNVHQPAYNAALQAELTGESLAALQAYERFHALTAVATRLSKPWQQAHFEFFDHYLRGIPALPPRWLRCTQEVDRALGEAVGQEFVRRTFAADIKAKTLLMTTLIERQMKEEIETLEWMSPATKQEALRKLAAIRNKVGYPDRWRDYSALTVSRTDYAGNSHRATDFESRREFAKIGKPLDRGEWHMTPPTVNAYFSSRMNDINFPAGVLQPPLYDANEDDAVNYGNTGSTIGHELTHGFDDSGRKFDAAGNLRDWWTKEDAKGFEERINCLRDQFATYTVVDDIHINSKLTSGEDVADLGGTLIAYLAWKEATANQRLAPVEGFTPDQRFFIGFGQWACANVRPEQLRVSALTDPHSPGEARINGIVTNMPQFADAFQCPKTAPMVKQTACKVW